MCVCNVYDIYIYIYITADKCASDISIMDKYIDTNWLYNIYIYLSC